MKGKIKCGFCDRPNIDPTKPHDEQGGQPICPECREEWKRCFEPQSLEHQKSFDFALT